MTRDEYVTFINAQLASLDVNTRPLVCNGVGSNLWYLRWARTPPDISILFLSAADWHDVAYACGGDDICREYADSHFDEICNDAINKLSSRFSRARARIWATICFDAVRIGGWLCDTDMDKPMTVDDYIKSKQGKKKNTIAELAGDLLIEYVEKKFKL